MRKTVFLTAALLVLAACGCGKPQTLPIIPSGQETGPGGKETIPEPGITYATEVLTLPATARDHYQIYQVNLKLYGNSGAFGKDVEDFWVGRSVEDIAQLDVFKVDVFELIDGKVGGAVD